jgi:hypothetical protein
MNYATYANLTNYATPALGVAAVANGEAFLVNETQIYQDGTMPKSGPASIKKSKQTQMASTLNPTVKRNQGNSGVQSGAIGGTYVTGEARTLTYNTATGGSKLSTKGGGTFVNRETVANTKTPAIRHKVSWYVRDDAQAAGYRRVFGLLEDAATTSPYRDDDAQVRK